MTGKIVLLSHCLLNPFSKVRGSPDNSDLAIKIHKLLRENQYGILQLPCPELLHGGLTRWGQTRYQYNSVFYRKHCELLVEEIVNQVEEYKRCNVPVGPILGINGSPSCGVSYTCEGPWGGELSQNRELENKIDQLQMIQGKGVFMEILEQRLRSKSITIEVIGIDEDKPEESLDKLGSYILHSEGKEEDYE
ncbi:CD3072 family TudS-related putative desulfidase [Desulfosporosinus sp. SYSU MS00001]|uniref:CD3072 family TudS-related putative desulfidase n=1 Tax=Desulfosporosinus sp. SYSU MS00001 TaxID=3416284 RepID=UPI003CEB34B5